MKIYINALVESRRDDFCWSTPFPDTSLLDYTLRQVQDVFPDNEPTIFANTESVHESAMAAGFHVKLISLRKKTQWRWLDVMNSVVEQKVSQARVLLLSPSLGMVTGDRLRYALGMIKDEMSFVSASPVSSLNHPCWLQMHEARYKGQAYVAQGSTVPTNFIDFPHHLEEEALPFFPSPDQIAGSQFLSSIFTIDGGIAYYGKDQPGMGDVDGNWGIHRIPTSTANGVPLLYKLPTFSLQN